MKNTLLTTILLSTFAVPVGVFAQAVIEADNTVNTGLYQGLGGTVANPIYSPLVRSNGLVFTLDPLGGYGSPGNPGPAGNQALYVDSGFTIVGGTTAASVAGISNNNVVLTWSGAEAVGDNINYGFLQGNAGNPNAVPGTTLAGTYWFNIFGWEGTTFLTYQAAIQGFDSYTGQTGPFQNSTGGPNASGPASPPSFLNGMPDLFLGMPEPSVFSLSSLGAAALILVRRRKT